MSEHEKVNRESYRKWRKRWIVFFSVTLAVLAVLTLVCTILSAKWNCDVYVRYEEEGNVIHRAYLSENEFYDETYLNGSHSYVASLIEKMTADFSYYLKMEADDVNFQYTYRIETQIEILDKGSNTPIFNPIETVVPQTTGYASGREFMVRELVELDFNAYNQLAKEFVTSYNLKSVKSTLIVRMHVDVVGMSESFAQDNSGEYVVELHVPLLETTVKPAVATTVPAGEQKIVSKDTSEKAALLTVAVVIGALTALVGGILALFAKRTRNEYIDYTRRVNLLVSNYKAYIQKVLDKYNTFGYQVIRVETFKTLLEIRDTIHQPIFMYENPSKTCTRFFVVTPMKTMYVYEIAVGSEYDDSTKDVWERLNGYISGFIKKI